MSTIDTRETAGEWNCRPLEYHANYDWIGHSMLDDFIENPTYYHGRFIARTIAATEPSAALRIGTLTHLLVLQPERWGEIVCEPKCDKRTKDGKALYAEFLEQSAGKIIADPEELATAKHCAAAVLAHAEASQLLAIESPWPKEHAIWWHDSDTGLTLKSLRDKATPLVLVDLKTCRTASPRGFSKAADDFGYARQVAHYLDGHLALTGERAEFFFIAVETHEPYSVAVHQLSERWVELAREENSRALNDLARRLIDNDWLPAFSKGVNLLDMPRYVAYRQEWE